MKRALLIISLVIISLSCVKDVDYDQIESANFRSPMSIAFLQLDLNQHDFLDSNNNEKPKFTRLFLINLEGLFNESTTDSLVLISQFSNTFDREFVCQFEYVDGDNVLLMVTDRFPIPSSTTTITQSTTYEGENFELFVRARKINVRVWLRNGNSMIDPFIDNSFTMQSVIHFDYELEI